MATVRNSINLQDRMTPVLRTIIRSMQSTIETMSSLDNVSNRAFDRARRDVLAASRALDEFNNGMDDIPDAANSATRSLGGMKNPLMNAASAIYTIKSLLAGLSRVTDMSDNFTLTTARLDLMNDGLQTTKELQDKIMASAERSRAAYGDTAASVAALGSQAKKAFSSNDEVIAFMEQINKTFVIAGTSKTGIESTMYNLTQALSSGVLRGQDLNTVLSNAQPIVQNIADYLKVPVGKIRDLAAQGKISAQVVKMAMFQAAEETNKKFADMPRTFGQAWTSAGNKAIQALGPLMQRINDVVNSSGFDAFITKTVTGINWVANSLMTLAGYIQNISEFIVGNWGWIEPLIWGIVGAFTAYNIVALATNGYLALQALQTGYLAAAQAVQTGATFAATAAQHGLNAALLANPIGAVIMAVVALIGVFIALGRWIHKLWQTNMDFKYGVIGIWNSIVDFFEQVPIFFTWVGNGIENAFDWAALRVLDIMQSMGNGVISIINEMISLINKIPGVAIKPIESQLTFATTAAVNAEATKQARDKNLVDMKSEAAINKLARDTTLAINKRNEIDEIARKQAEKDANAGESDVGYDYAKLRNIAGGKLDSIGKIDSDVKISEEDIMMLKDVAKIEFINQYTSMRPEMVVNISDVKETADVRDLLTAMEEMIEEAYASSLIGEAI